jgi:hypothetical protein
MKRSSATVLRAIIVLVGVAAAAFLLWEPHVEGRNAHASLFEIYFRDPFLAYAYFGSIPFFVILYQAFKAFGLASQAEVSPQEVVRALRLIRYNALAFIGLIALGEVFIFSNTSDDRAGGVFMGVLATLVTILIATVATLIGRGLQRQIPPTYAK